MLLQLNLCEKNSKNKNPNSKNYYHKKVIFRSKIRLRKQSVLPESRREDSIQTIQHIEIRTRSPKHRKTARAFQKFLQCLFLSGPGETDCDRHSQPKPVWHIR